MNAPYAEVIGDPIAHSKSPLIHRFWLEKSGLEYDYRPAHVRPEGLGDYFASRVADPAWCGCNVTIPHKQSALKFVQDCSPVARTLGAANCITRHGSAELRLVADNTDWLGFMEPIQFWAEQEVTYKFAYVIGAGGAAAAVSYALSRAGFTVVSIARDAKKALALRQRLDLFDDDLVADLKDWGKRIQPIWAQEERSDRIDILVNTTPLGMAGYPDLDLDLAGLPEDMLVYDIVYNPLETTLLRQARQRGMPTVDGLGMLIGQAAAAFELFFIERAPREHDEELRRLLTS